MPNVKLLLKEKVETLGELGQIVSVKPGYARNFLLPKGIAVIPTLGEIKSIEKKKKLLEEQYNQEKLQAEEIAKKLSKAGEIVIYATCGEAGKLFGRITAKDITEKINSELSTNIERKQLLLKHSINDMGEYEIKIKLHAEVTSQIKIVIKKEE